MKIFLIGANGQVGSQIKKLYDKNEFKLISFSKEQLDITDSSKVEQLVKYHSPNILINAAAYTNVQQAEDDFQLANAINNLAVLNLSNLCEKNKILLIHISTDFVFDGENNIPYTENDIVNPLNVYGKTKNEGEMKIISNSKLFIILRTSWVFSDLSNNFVSKIKNKLLDSKKIEVVNDQFGCPTSAHSIAFCILNMCKYFSYNMEIESGVYHFCGKPVTTWYLFASEILNNLKISNFEYMNREIIPINSINLLSKLKRPKYSALDCTKIKSVFNLDQSNWLKDLANMSVGSNSDG